MNPKGRRLLLRKDNQMPKKGTRKCQGCGQWKTDVTDGYDPFAAEILGIREPVQLCAYCYQLRADEI